MPEFIDPVFTKTNPKRSFSMTENERFRLVFAKTWSIKSGTGYNGSLTYFHFFQNEILSTLVMELVTVFMQLYVRLLFTRNFIPPPTLHWCLGGPWHGENVWRQAGMPGMRPPDQTARVSVCVCVCKCRPTLET